MRTWLAFVRSFHFTAKTIVTISKDMICDMLYEGNVYYMRLATKTKSVYIPRTQTPYEALQGSGFGFRTTAANTVSDWTCK